MHCLSCTAQRLYRHCLCWNPATPLTNPTLRFLLSHSSSAVRVSCWKTFGEQMLRGKTHYTWKESAIWILKQWIKSYTNQGLLSWIKYPSIRISWFNLCPFTSHPTISQMQILFKTITGLGRLTFIVCLEALSTDCVIAHQPQGQHHPCTHNRSRQLETR